MKKIALFLGLILLLTPALALIPSAASSDNYYHGDVTNTIYWIPYYDNYEYDQYRIPGMVVTKQGTVIIYGESRRLDVNRDDWGENNHDLCEMDLYLCRSTDGGETFDEKIVIAEGEQYFNDGYGETINNPVMIVGNDGRLHLLYACNTGRGGLWYTYSDDDGITWTEPEDVISGFENDAPWSMLACGPGHGICTRDGRLIVPAWLYFEGVYQVYTIYSDDNGATWQLGAPASNNKDETAIVELSDGQIMLNSRQRSFPDAANSYRAISVSKSGIDDWSETYFDKTLIDPACEGSMCSVDIEGLPYAILFSNCADKSNRRNITVRCSFNDGITWEKSISLDANAGGYSDIAVDDQGKVYVLYEVNSGSKLMLATFSFYDVFCADDESLSSSVNYFNNPFVMVSKKEGVSVSKSGESGLKVDLTADYDTFVTLDITKLTGLLKADEVPIFAMRLKANVAAEAEEILGGVYFRCGRNNKSVASLYMPYTITNNGEYQNVILDTKALKNFKGNLYSVELAFTVPNSVCTTGDSFEIEAFGFYSSADAAKAVFSIPAEAPTETDTDPAPSDEKRGCKSAITPQLGVCVLGIAVVSVCFLRKRSKRFE